MLLRTLIGRSLGPADLDEVRVVWRVIGGSLGTMVDVGAHHGSALAPFLASGWTVHAFEPDPTNRAVLAADFPAALIDPRAISEVDGEEVQLFTSHISTGISSLSPFHDTHAPTASVRTVRLDTYLREHSVEHVDFLKTDIEGFDLFALRTFPWNGLRPKAVVCEYEDHKTKRLGYDVHDIAGFLEGHGYSVVVSEWEPIVEYGTRHKWRRFVRYPAEIPTDTWGNLIAVEPALLGDIERSARSTVRQLRMRQRVDRLRAKLR